LRFVGIACAALAVAACSGAPKCSDTVFVSNEGSNEVTLVDGATGQVEGRLANYHVPIAQPS
jgi:hypothetical protein